MSKTEKDRKSDKKMTEPNQRTFLKFKYYFTFLI